MRIIVILGLYMFYIHFIISNQSLLEFVVDCMLNDKICRALLRIIHVLFISTRESSLRIKLGQKSECDSRAQDL